MSTPNPLTVLNADEKRIADVSVKQRRVAELLDRTGYDALLLQKPHNIAWFAAGGNVGRASCETSAAVFITREARLIITNNVDAPQLFEREFFGLGFQLKQRAWHESHAVLLGDLLRGRRVASDTGLRGTANVDHEIQKERLSLTELETERMRLLGRVAVHSVEATARTIYPGQTESEIAAEVAHRLMKRTVTPEVVRVCADGRSERFRHWTYGTDPVNRYAVISCIARRWGLCIGLSRTVSLEPIPKDLYDAHRKAMLMHATGMFFSRHGSQLSDVWPKVHRIYEKFGMPHEWQLADQAHVIGFEPREVQLTPDCDFTLQAPMAMHWHPSVGPAMLGDTVLVNEHEVEFLTRSRDWPRLTVEVKGHAIHCPDIYVVPAEDQQPAEAETLVELPDEPKERRTSHLFDPPTDDDVGMDSVWEMEISTSGINGNKNAYTGK